MNLITNNPYRIIGLLANASAREQEKQKRRILHFIQAEQEPEPDFSFPILGNLERNLENVNEAVAKLNLDNDRINSALFWFYRGNEITDEPAFDLLKESNRNGAVDIWLKLIDSNEITKRNCSAYHNLSTLLLCHSLNEGQFNSELFKKSLTLKLKFLESDFFSDLVNVSTDETFRISKKEIQLTFLNLLVSELEKSGQLDLKLLLNTVDKQEFSAKEEFVKNLVKKPIERIESKIAEAKASRKSNKANALNAGRLLYQQTHQLLLGLNSLVAIPSIKVSSISDKLSMELLQCGIDYFTFHKDTNKDPSRDAMDLFIKAKHIAVGEMAKERCKENMIGLQEWIDDKPDRDRQNLVREDFLFIVKRIEQFTSSDPDIQNAKDFLFSCKPKLLNIKTKLGTLDDFYIKMCDAVVNNTEGMVIQVVNDAVERRSKYVEYINFKNSLGFMMPDFKGLSLDNLSGILNNSGRGVSPAPEYSLEKLKQVISLAWNAILKLKEYDMSSVRRQNFIKNMESLRNLYKQVNKGFVFVKDKPIHISLFIITGLIVIFLLVYAIGGKEGASTFFTVLLVLGILFFIGWARNQ